MSAPPPVGRPGRLGLVFFAACSRWGRRSRSAIIGLPVQLGEKVEAERATLSVIFDRLREAGVAPCLPELGKGPMVDVDRDRSRGFKLDADQADDRAKVDHAIDSHPYWLHHNLHFLLGCKKASRAVRTTP